MFEETLSKLLLGPGNDATLQTTVALQQWPYSNALHAFARDAVDALLMERRIDDGNQVSPTPGQGFGFCLHRGAGRCL